MIIIEWLKKHPGSLRILVLALAVISAFAWGRFSAPSKIVTKTDIQYKDKVVVQTQIEYRDRIVTKVVYQKRKDLNIHTKTITKEIINPNGQKIITKVVTNDTQSNTTVDRNSSKTNQIAQNTNQKVQKTEEEHIQKSKEVDYVKPSWMFSVKAGMNWSQLSLSKSLADQPWLIGAEVDRRIIGPFWLGIWDTNDIQFKNINAGLSLGLQL